MKKAPSLRGEKGLAIIFPYAEGPVNEGWGKVKKIKEEARKG